MRYILSAEAPPRVPRPSLSARASHSRAPHGEVSLTWSKERHGQRNSFKIKSFTRRVKEGLFHKYQNQSINQGAGTHSQNKVCRDSTMFKNTAETNCRASPFSQVLSFQPLSNFQGKLAVGLRPEIPVRFGPPRSLRQPPRRPCWQ